MGRSKWLKVTDVDQPISKVAKKALSNRVRVVIRFAALAAYDFRDDVEFVHQLRVATRRAQSSISLFWDLLDEPNARWINAKLRSLRKAAGDARDLDVLLMRLNKSVKRKNDKDCRHLLTQIRKLRKGAQHRLVATVENLKRKRFAPRCKSVVKKIDQHGNIERATSFRIAAHAKLEPLVSKFFKAAASNLSDIDVLHSLRISAKRLRYAMELLWCAFDGSFFRSVLCPAFAELQEEIGRVNDHATAVAMFNKWLVQSDDRRSRRILAKLAKKEARQMQSKFELFRDGWTTSRVQELRQQFTRAFGGVRVA